MKILISFHNKEGYENIIPVAEYLKKKDFRITLLDLCPYYLQDSNDNNFFAKTKLSKAVSGQFL